MAHLGWTEDAVSGSGICERGFTVERQGQAIPGVVWHPAAPSGPRAGQQRLLVRHQRHEQQRLLRQWPHY